jgi:hypothetical protein
VFRGPHRTWVELKAGCAEILGRRSRVVAEETPVDTAEGEASRGGLDEDGKIVGRRGARAVNVLKLISIQAGRRDVWHTYAQIPYEESSGLPVMRLRALRGRPGPESIGGKALWKFAIR